MDNELYFRRALSADRDVVQKLYYDAVEWISAAKGLRQWRREAFNDANIVRMIEETEMYIVNLHGEIAGAFYIQWHRDEVWGELYHDDAGYIHRLVTARKWKGRGLGSRMLDWAEERIMANGRSWLRLDCMADNPSLNRYYASLGMTYRDRVDAGRWSASLYERKCGEAS
jgi:ribosomal protein S18 acetylase RimI-like enzyme